MSAISWRDIGNAPCAAIDRGRATEQPQHRARDALLNPLRRKLPVAILQLLQALSEDRQCVQQDARVAVQKPVCRLLIPAGGDAVHDASGARGITGPGEQWHRAEHLA